MIFWHLGFTWLVVFVTLGRRRLDYRVVSLGAILPDLVDKPTGRIFFEATFEASRLFGHTLAFALLMLLVIQIVFRGRVARVWFVLPVACVIHLALDAMWSDPVTLFWPLFGTEFPRHPVDNYWLEVLLRPFEHPLDAVREIAGIAVLAYFAWGFALFRRDPLRRFLRTGELRGAEKVRAVG